jgi:hypothetical protein
MPPLALLNHDFLCAAQSRGDALRISNGHRHYPEWTNFFRQARCLPGRSNDVCGYGDIANDLQPNSEWRMEIADELGKTLFKLTFSSESLE